MSTYAIGDIQGCQQELLDLLNAINFDPDNDQIWFVGDLVNRGPASLATLRFVRDLGNSAITVLGNHDLHLLTVAFTDTRPRKKDTLDSVLTAPDRGELLDWLRRQPLLHHDPDSGYTLVHAGIAPLWDLHQAQDCADEVQTLLSGKDCREILDHIYGNEPDTWNNEHEGRDRWRYTINVLTRMRYCYPDGRLVLHEKGPPGTQSGNLKPWFELKQRRNRDQKIVFGHWSTLRLSGCDYTVHNVYPLDTGCIWGGRLTALRLEDKKEFSVPSLQPKIKHEN